MNNNTNNYLIYECFVIGSLFHYFGLDMQIIQDILSRERSRSRGNIKMETFHQIV